MSHKHRLALFCLDEHCTEEEVLSQEFKVYRYTDEDQLMSELSQIEPDLLLLHGADSEQVVDVFENIKKQMHDPNMHAVLVADKIVKQSRIRAFSAGADDLFEANIPGDELVARCFQLIFDKIANKQLQTQVQQANQMAHLAMSNTSDLGVNIQFLLDSSNCNDFSELGLRCFAALRNYGLKCSLQMRGRYEVKDMEENGMSRDMESRLLFELKDAGRYYDFGSRCVMNYESVSLLVKNMPTDDPDKFGALKDNVFSLLQGVDARLKALDNETILEQEVETISMLVQKMAATMKSVEEANLNITSASAEVLEGLAGNIEELLPFLGLELTQEEKLEKHISESIEKNQKIFSSMLKVDEGFKRTIERLNSLFVDGNRPSSEEILKLIS